MKYFLAVKPSLEFVDLVNSNIFAFKNNFRAFTFENYENMYIPVALLGYFEEDKLPYLKEAIQQSVYDIDETRLYTNNYRFIQRELLILFLTFHKNKSLETIRDRISYYCSKEKENKVNKSFEPSFAVMFSKLGSKQQYLHLKKKISNINVELELNVSSVDLIAQHEKTTSFQYEKIHTFKLVV